MQNPRDLTDIECDICGRELAPKDKFILWTVGDAYSGTRAKVFIGEHCAVSRLGVNPAVFKHPASRKA